jgi:hypothetical protein
MSNSFSGKNARLSHSLRVKFSRTPFFLGQIKAKTPIKAPFGAKQTDGIIHAKVNSNRVDTAKKIVTVDAPKHNQQT